MPIPRPQRRQENRIVEGIELVKSIPIKISWDSGIPTKKIPGFPKIGEKLGFPKIGNYSKIGIP